MNKQLFSILSVVSVPALLAAGCSETTNPPAGDTGVQDTGADSGVCGFTGPGSTPAAATTMPLTFGAGSPANFSCLGRAGTKTSSGPFTGTAFSTESFGTGAAGAAGAPLLGATVEIFNSNTVGTGAQSVTVDGSGNGNAMLGATGSWYSYRIAPFTHPLATLGSHLLTVGYNRPVGDRVQAISANIVSQLTTVIMRQRQPGTGLLAGSVYDCDGRLVSNARVEVYVNGHLIGNGTSQTSPKLAYFGTNGSPDNARTTTSAAGLFGQVNLPVVCDSDVVRVEAYGIVGSGAEQRISCEEGRVFPNALTILSATPGRNDYAAGSGCAGRITAGTGSDAGTDSGASDAGTDSGASDAGTSDAGTDAASDASST